MDNEWLKQVAVGDWVTRNLAGIPMKLRVTEVTEDRIVCMWWEFSRNNGAEIDPELGWNEKKSGSVLIQETSND